jgi:hypothetical protein
MKLYIITSDKKIPIEQFNTLLLDNLATGMINEYSGASSAEPGLDLREKEAYARGRREQKDRDLLIMADFVASRGDSYALGKYLNMQLDIRDKAAQEEETLSSEG